MVATLGTILAAIEAGTMLVETGRKLVDAMHQDNLMSEAEVATYKTVMDRAFATRRYKTDEQLAAEGEI